MTRGINIHVRGDEVQFIRNIPRTHPNARLEEYYLILPCNRLLYSGVFHLPGKKKYDTSFDLDLEIPI